MINPTFDAPEHAAKAWRGLKRALSKQAEHAMRNDLDV